MKWKLYLRIFLILVFLYIFYAMGLPWSFIITIAVIFLLAILFRTKLYNQIEKFLDKKIPILLKLSPSVRKIIIFIIFILIYILLKQAIFAILQLFGVDIQGILTESINQSLGV